jgi:glycosyltransferase involved in cell wall biosynthesis
MMARYCDRIISVNTYDREWAIRLGIVSSPEQIVTVYNGISTERLAAVGSPDRAALLKEAGVEGEVSVLVNLARLAPQKAQRYLLEAMPTVVSRVKRPVHLFLVGNGEDEDTLRALTRRLGLDDNVHFLGFRRDGLAWLKVADMSILSSLWEGHSVTILEAMGLGTPVIATDIKGNRETIDHDRNGLLVKPKDPLSLAEAIVRYLNDPESARRHAQAARADFFEKYTERHVQENTWSVYRELLEEKELLDRLP